MFTENLFSSRAVSTDLLKPDDKNPEYIKDYERGGIDLRQPVAGINVQDWVFYIDGDNIFAEAATTGVKYPILSGEPYKEVVGTFDRNMNPVLVYLVENTYYFYWFDTKTNSFETEELPSNVSSPRLCHDDKRHIAIDYSDVIVTYIQDNKLIYRLQRDRFSKNYIAGTKNVKGREIIRFGMNKSLRLQWTLDQATKYRE